MNKSESFFYGGGVSILIGSLGTVFSSYYVYNSKNKDPNATIKKVGLALSITTLLIGIFLLIYYHYGYKIDSMASYDQLPDEVTQNGYIAVQPPLPPAMVPPLPQVPQVPQVPPTSVNIYMAPGQIKPTV